MIHQFPKFDPFLVDENHLLGRYENGVLAVETVDKLKIVDEAVKKSLSCKISGFCTWEEASNSKSIRKLYSTGATTELGSPDYRDLFDVLYWWLRCFWVYFSCQKLIALPMPEFRPRHICTHLVYPPPPWSLYMCSCTKEKILCKQKMGRICPRTRCHNCHMPLIDWIL